MKTQAETTMNKQRLGIFAFIVIFLLLGGIALLTRPWQSPAPTSAPQPLATLPAATEVPPWTIVRVTPVSGGFRQPTFVTHAGDGSGRLFVVEKEGTVRILQDGKVLSSPFLDIWDRVRSRESERGLLSIAFHPRYAENGRFFVDYTDQEGATIVAEYRVTSDPNVADAHSERVLLRIPQPASNHNGGQLHFGPDGYLYIGMGDGGSAGDPWGNAQNKGVLLGKLLRIDVDTDEPYGIPPDNPFVNESGARPEIWAYGLRNPWRFSFDRRTGDLYIADVGQNKWEEVDVQPAASKGGENYGWDIMEGFHCFEPPTWCNPAGLTLPVVEYGHDQGCSITGGYVYRGNRYPALDGTYFFSDFCTGHLWGLKRGDNGWVWTKFTSLGMNVSTFGEGEDGEIYVVDYSSGTLYHIQGPEPEGTQYLPWMSRAYAQAFQRKEEALKEGCRR